MFIPLLGHDQSGIVMTEDLKINIETVNIDKID